MHTRGSLYRLCTNFVQRTISGHSYHWRPVSLFADSVPVHQSALRCILDMKMVVARVPMACLPRIDHLEALVKARLQAGISPRGRSIGCPEMHLARGLAAVLFLDHCDFVRSQN